MLRGFSPERRHALAGDTTAIRSYGGPSLSRPALTGTALSTTPPATARTFTRRVFLQRGLTFASLAATAPMFLERSARAMALPLGRRCRASRACRRITCSSSCSSAAATTGSTRSCRTATAPTTTARPRLAIPAPGRGRRRRGADDRRQRGHRAAPEPHGLQGADRRGRRVDRAGRRLPEPEPVALHVDGHLAHGRHQREGQRLDRPLLRQHVRRHAEPEAPSRSGAPRRSP